MDVSKHNLHRPATGRLPVGREDWGRTGGKQRDQRAYPDPGCHGKGRLGAAIRLGASCSSIRISFETWSPMFRSVFQHMIRLEHSCRAGLIGRNSSRLLAKYQEGIRNISNEVDFFMSFIVYI